MTDWTQYHPTQPMTTPDGHTVDIHVEMIPLVTELWRLGYTTNLACQDADEAVLEAGTRTTEDDRPRAAARNMGRPGWSSGLSRDLGCYMHAGP